MKKALLFTLVFISVFNCGFSQNFWKSLDNPRGVNIHQIGIDLYGNYYINIRGDHNIFRSIDSCKTWTNLDKGLEGSYINVRKFINGLDSSLYLLTNSDVFVLRPNYDRWKKININTFYINDISVNPQGYIYIVGENKIYKSTDNGALFRPIMNINSSFNSLISTNGNDKNFVILEDENYDSVVFVFNDDGTNLEKKSFPQDMPEANGIMYDTTTNRLFIYGWGEGYFSDDEGLTWVKMNIEDKRNGFRYMTISPGGELFCNNWKETYKSVDSGDTWNKLDNVEKHCPNGIKSIAFKDAKNIFVLPETRGSTLDFELGITDNNFKNFQSITTRIKQPQITEMSKDSNGVMFINIAYSIWLVSFDDLQTWDTLNAPEESKHFYHIEHDQSGNIYGLASDKKLYRSPDYGVTWIDITPHIDEFAYLIDVHVNQEGKIYLIGSDNLYKSNDYGENWSTFKKNSSVYSESKWLFHPDGTIYSYSDIETYFSKDDGITWSPLLDYHNIIFDFHITKNGTVLISCEDPNSDYSGISLFKYEDGNLIKLKDNLVCNSIESNLSGDIFVSTSNRILRLDQNGKIMEDITYNLKDIAFNFDRPERLTLYIDNNQFLYTYSEYDIIYKSKFSTTRNHNLTGYVFLDENKNCSKDTEENGIQDWKLELSGTSERHINTDENGKFTTNLTNGNYTFELIIPDNDLWTTCQIDTSFVLESDVKDTTVVIFLVQKKKGTSISDVQTSISNTIVYPQPFSDKTNITIENSNMPDNSEFIVYNRLGEAVYHKKIYSNNIEFNKNGLPSGLYLFKVLSENKIISIGKLIIQ